MNSNNFNLILLFLFIIFILYEYNNSEEINNVFFDTKCNSSNCQIEDNVILLIGKDSNNKYIFKYEEKLYSIIDDKIILYDDNNEIIYYTYPIKVPFNLSNMTLKIKINFNDYEYIGILNNNYYNQEYLLYEKPYDLNDKMEEKLYYYILVKIINNKYIIMYELPPRQKILPEENIWVSYGSFQLGPLLFN
jgi:hypothetical protein